MLFRSLDPASVSLLGQWIAGAANESGLVMASDVFVAALTGEPVASNEIEELRWLPIEPGVDYAADASLSPMLVEHVVPALLTQTQD